MPELNYSKVQSVQPSVTLSRKAKFAEIKILGIFAFAKNRCLFDCEAKTLLFQIEAMWWFWPLPYLEIRFLGEFWSFVHFTFPFYGIELRAKISQSKFCWICLGCIAQRKHSCFPPSSPGFDFRLCQDFLSLLLSLWRVLRSNPARAKQRISQMQFALTARAKYYKKVLLVMASNVSRVVREM